MSTIYPIGGGKGGVGKSFIAASLGALMAMGGRRVAVMDLDLGASNLHTLLGIKSPKTGLSHFLNKDARLLERVAVPTHLAGLSLISSCQCATEVANLPYAQKMKLVRAIQNLPYDAVVLDLGAGTNFNTIDFFITADRGVVVCTPEPTAVENTFRFIKAVHYRRLKKIIKQGPFNDKVKTAVLDSANGEMTYSAALKCVEANDVERWPDLKARMASFHFDIIINQHRKTADPALGLKLDTVCNRHFSTPFRFTGRIDFDERIHDAVYQKKLFVELFPNAPVSANLKQIVRELVRLNPKSTEKRSHYENVGQ